MSPATTEVTRRWLSSVTLTMKSQPAIRAISVFCFVDRVAVEDAAVGLGMLEQLGAVPALDRLERGHAGTDQLAAAGVAGHQVRLDQAGGDLQVGLDVAACRSSRESRARSCRPACALRAGCRNGPRRDSRPRSPRPSISSFSARCWAGASRWRPGSSVCSRGMPASLQDLRASAAGSSGWEPAG